ncbi:unnamed protein product [Amoebophrya sp. A25]|nr:unnamed protein product [Amoebophrya sp. A25]|eukprot:GSA25T00014585001.1
MIGCGGRSDASMSSACVADLRSDECRLCRRWRDEDAELGIHSLPLGAPPYLRARARMLEELEHSRRANRMNLNQHDSSCRATWAYEAPTGCGEPSCMKMREQACSAATTTSCRMLYDGGAPAVAVESLDPPSMNGGSNADEKNSLGFAEEPACCARWRTEQGLMAMASSDSPCSSLLHFGLSTTEQPTDAHTAPQTFSSSPTRRTKVGAWEDLSLDWRSEEDDDEDWDENTEMHELQPGELVWRYRDFVLLWRCPVTQEMGPSSWRLVDAPPCSPCGGGTAAEHLHQRSEVPQQTLGSQPPQGSCATLSHDASAMDSSFELSLSDLVAQKSLYCRLAAEFELVLHFLHKRLRSAVWWERRLTTDADFLLGDDAQSGAAGQSGSVITVEAILESLQPAAHYLAAAEAIEEIPPMQRWSLFREYVDALCSGKRAGPDLYKWRRNKIRAPGAAIPTSGGRHGQVAQNRPTTRGDLKQHKLDHIERAGEEEQEFGKASSSSSFSAAHEQLSDAIRTAKTSGPCARRRAREGKEKGERRTTGGGSTTFLPRSPSFLQIITGTLSSSASSSSDDEPDLARSEDEVEVEETTAGYGISRSRTGSTSTPHDTNSPLIEARFKPPSGGDIFEWDIRYDICRTILPMIDLVYKKP